MTDFATLVLAADSRGLKTGEQALDSLASTAGRTEGVTSKAMQDIERSTGIAGNGLSALADRARKSADAFMHFARLESQVDSLAASIDPIYASSKRYEVALEQLNAALDAGVISQGRYNTLLRQTEAALFSSNRSTGMMRMQTANLGYQIQDIGMMMAMGQNPFMLLAQQLPQITMHGGQLTGVMGALRTQFANLLSPLGLLTTGVVLAGSAAMAYFSDTEEEAETLEDRIESLSSVTKSYVDAVDDARTSVKDLGQDFGLQAEQAQRLYEIMRQIRELEFQEALDATRDAITASLEGISESIDRYNFASLYYEQADAVQAISSEVQILENQFGLTLVQATRISDALEDMRTANGPLEVADAAERLAEELGKATTEGADLPPELRSAQKSAAQAAFDALQFANALGLAADNAAATADQMDRFAAAMARDGGLSSLTTLNPFNSTPFQDEGEILRERWSQNFADSQADWQKRQPKGRKAGRGSSRPKDNFTDEMREAERIFSDTRTAAERYRSELTDLQELHDMGYLSADTYSRAVAKIDEEYRNASEAGKFFNDISEDLKNGILDAIIEGDNLADTFENLAKSIARAALEAALFGSGPFAAGGGKGGGGLLGGLFGGLFGGFFANGGTLGAGKWGIAGEAGPEIIHGPANITPMSKAGGSSDVVKIVLRDDSGRMAAIADQQIQTASGTIVNVAVERSRSQILPTVADYQGNRAGSDFRVG